MRRIVACLFALVVVGGCGERQPVRIGFLGGLSGSVADLGESGRNGAQIAVEEVNRSGGVNGRQVELFVRDDAQSPEQAIVATNELVALHVEGIVGPMTSAMAEVALPVAQQAGIVLVSPTVTAHKFFGLEDNLFLLMSSTREEARLSAEFHFDENGARRVAAIHDLKNRAYTESWLREFTVAFQGLGGEVFPVPYESRTEVNFGSIVRAALSKQPDAVLMIAGAADAARFAQKVRERNRQILLFGSQWAATERLVELGGQSVEGMVLHNYFDRDSKAPELVRLRELYAQRFLREPGFAGIAAYDATRILLTALSRRQNGEPLQETLLIRGPFPGAEGGINFDRFGDNRRVSHVTVVRDGQFVTLR